MRGTLIVLAVVFAACAAGKAEDLKPARTLAEEAQSLSTEGGWVSEEVTLTLAGGKKEKGRVAIRFAAEKGKPSGKVTSGVVFGDGKTEAAAWVGDKDTFELVVKDGERKIKIHRPDFKEVTFLPYTLDGNTLRIESGGSTNWAGAGVTFDGTKFALNKPKK